MCLQVLERLESDSLEMLSMTSQAAKCGNKRCFFYHVLSVMVKLWSSYGNHHVISPCFFMVISPWWFCWNFCSFLLEITMLKLGTLPQPLANLRRVHLSGPLHWILQADSGRVEWKAADRRLRLAGTVPQCHSCHSCRSCHSCHSWHLTNCREVGKHRKMAR